MKKKIAVLHAQVPFVHGGAELHVYALKKHLIEKGFDAEIIQLPYKWYPANSLYNSMLAWRMLDLSESNGQKIDLVIGTKFPSYGAIHENKVAWVIHQFRQVYDLYNTNIGYAGVPDGSHIRDHVKKFDKQALQEAKSVYANSKNVANRLERYTGIASTPLYHPPMLAGQYKSGEYGDYILSVGRLDPLKRNDLLLRAIAKTNGKIRAKIAGKGPELENLKKLAVTLKIESQIDFLGFVPDEELPDLYANAFGVYFAPVDEDYGYITLEAFFSQKPVLTCIDSGGPLEFVKDAENGYICEPNDEQLADAMMKLYENRNMCKKFGANGLDVVKGITWDHVIQELTKTL
mgnify:CR=1 FL=1